MNWVMTSSRAGATTPSLGIRMRFPIKMIMNWNPDRQAIIFGFLRM